MKQHTIHFQKLEKLYQHFNHSKHISPDPLELVHQFNNPSDQEIVALVVSSLSYGGVQQILASCRKILALMGSSPFNFLQKKSNQEIIACLEGFKHRWHTGADIAALLISLKNLYQEYSSLLNVFLKSHRKNHENTLPALEAFISHIKARAPYPMRPNLLSEPGAKSACKRLHMFLRWMVRFDKVDIGLWHTVPASQLLIPLDTHIHKLSLALGLTRRKQADLRTVLEITEGFKKINPIDPIRYDFCLSRLGIKKDSSVKDMRNYFINKWN